MVRFGLASKNITILWGLLSYFDEINAGTFAFVLSWTVM